MTLDVVIPRAIGLVLMVVALWVLVDWPGPLAFLGWILWRWH